MIRGPTPPATRELGRGRPAGCPAPSNGRHPWDNRGTAIATTYSAARRASANVRPAGSASRAKSIFDHSAPPRHARDGARTAAAGPARSSRSWTPPASGRSCGLRQRCPHADCTFQIESCSLPVERGSCRSRASTELSHGRCGRAGSRRRERSLNQPAVRAAMQDSDNAAIRASRSDHRRAGTGYVEHRAADGRPDRSGLAGRRGLERPWQRWRRAAPRAVAPPEDVCA